METLHKKSDPWEDGQDRYIGVVLMVQPVDVGILNLQQSFTLINACYEEIPNVRYSTTWLKWVEMLLGDDVDEDGRISYFSMTVFKNQAKGSYRVIAADWHSKGKEGKKLIDTPIDVWEALPRTLGEDIIFGVDKKASQPSAPSTPKRVIRKKPQLRKIAS